MPNGSTTEELVAEYAEGREPELTPAFENVALGPLIEPYEHATPVSLDMLSDSGEQMS